MTTERRNRGISQPLVLGVGVPLAVVSLGLVIGLGIADDLPVSAAAPRMVVFATVTAIPIALAVYAARAGRPTLLGRAGTIAVVTALIAGPGGYALGIAGLVWIFAASRGGQPFNIDGATLVVSGLWAAAILVALLHEDPLCVDTSDYTVCADNVTVWWEAAASVLLALTAVLVAVTRPEKNSGHAARRQPTHAR